MERFNDAVRTERGFDLRPPAEGQVIVIPFRQSITEILTTTDLETVLIIKPQWRGVPYFKFCGGMLQAGERFPAAALRELAQETGVIGDRSQLVEVDRRKKRQHSSRDLFDVVSYAAFGCDFKGLKDSQRGEYGDEGEVSLVIPFTELLEPDHSWPIPTDPERSATLFAQHMELPHKTAQLLNISHR